MSSNEIIATLLGMVLTIGMSLGFSKAISSRQARDIDELQAEQRRLSDRLVASKDEARAAFVSLEHFNEAINSLREIQRDMRDDLKKLIDLMTKRKSRP